MGVLICPNDSASVVPHPDGGIVQCECLSPVVLHKELTRLLADHPRDAFLLTDTFLRLHPTICWNLVWLLTCFGLPIDFLFSGGARNAVGLSNPGSSIERRSSGTSIGFSNPAATGGGDDSAEDGDI
jgi:hypothetical protein